MRCQEIVKSLAEFDPGWECVFCGEYAHKGDWESYHRKREQDVAKHAPNCLWRRAKEETDA